MKYVIVGGGAAGYTAAKELRRLDPRGEITLVGEEVPYSRPMLSKAPLRGFRVKELQPRERYAEENIRLVTGLTARQLDTEKRTVTLSDGEVLPYDRCILATGARAFRPPIPGGERGLAVRTAGDVEQLRRLRLTARSAAVIGGGVIGLEIAWELHKSGLPVTVLELEPNLMQRLLDPETSAALKKIAENQGISVETGVKIREIREHSVCLEDREIPGDLVILSCGIRAETDLARQAGLAVNWGILVSDTMETSVPGVYACGDCTEFRGANAGTWTQAIAQGTAAARNAAGVPETYVPGVPELIFQGLNTALYAAGDPGRDPDCEIHIREAEEESTLTVNRRPGPGRERLVYRRGHLAGAVLLGSLRKMPEVRKALGHRREANEI